MTQLPPHAMEDGPGVEFQANLGELLDEARRRGTSQTAIAAGLPSGCSASSLTVWRRIGGTTLPSNPHDVAYLQHTGTRIWRRWRPDDPVPDIIGPYLAVKRWAGIPIEEYEQTLELAPDELDPEASGAQPGDRALAGDLAALAGQVNSLRGRLSKASPLDRVVKHLLKKTAEAAGGYESKTISVSTHELYELLLRELPECDRGRIIDQAADRWNELLSDGQSIGFNAFNYSKDILMVSASMAERNDKFSVERVLVVPVDKTTDLERICRILETVDRLSSRFPRQLVNRVYVPDGDRLLQMWLQQVMDAVLLEFGDRPFLLLKEAVDWRKREDSARTISTVSASEEEKERFVGTFKEVFDKAMTISEFRDKYDPRRRTRKRRGEP